MTIISARLAVEKVLRDAGQPLDAVEVAKRSGQTVQIARNHLSTAIKCNKVRNIGKANSGLYVWCVEPATPPLVIESRIPKDNYYGEKPLPMRAGAMDAFECGSVEGGVWVERKRPVLITAIPEGR